jgi:hypothetical protein
VRDHLEQKMKETFFVSNSPQFQCEDVFTLMSVCIIVIV